MSSVSTETSDCIFLQLSLHKDGVTLEEIQDYLKKNDVEESLRNIQSFLSEDYSIQEDTRDGVSIYRDIQYIPEAELNVFRLDKETFLEMYKEIYKNINVNRPVEMFNTSINGDKRHTVFDYLIHLKCLREIRQLLEVYPRYAMYFLGYNYYTQKCAVEYLTGESSNHISILICQGLIRDKTDELRNKISDNNINIRTLHKRSIQAETAYMIFHGVTLVSIVCIQVYLYYINHYS
jgi:hypothetical protein